MMVVITLSVITFKRPDSLSATLLSLGNIVLPKDTQVRLLVVDNDPEQSALDTVNAIKNAMNFSVEYTLEEKRGIPYARNRALAEAASGDYIAFIDDDDTA